MTERIETGPLKIGDDWPGVFIRGDTALVGFATALETLINGDALEMEKAVCASLLSTLKSCMVPCKAQAAFTAADLARAYEMGRDDAANECNERGRVEQENYGLVRGTQNFYRARDIIRALTPPADLAEKVRK